MGSFIVNLDLAPFDADFWELLPAHRKIVNDLLVEGIIEMYAINEERNQGWIVFQVGDENQVRTMLDHFPIRDYFTYEIHALFIFNNSVSLWPKVNLN